MTRRVYEFVFCTVLLWSVYLRLGISSNASSVAGVPFDSVGSLVCVPAVIRVLAVWQHHKPKTKNRKHYSTYSCPHWHSSAAPTTLVTTNCS